MTGMVCNPFLPSWEYVPDGEPHVFEERLYLYGSHDRFGRKEYCMNDYVCWSAPVTDLSDWRYEGVIYRKEQDPRSKGEIPLYAPDVARGPDGRYYLYYSPRDSSVISVAVCDTPAGRYEYYGDVCRPDGSVRGEAKEDPLEFDPAVLVDDDGRIWLYSGTGQASSRRLGHPVVGAFVQELETDMKTVKGKPNIIMPFVKFSIKQPAFFEGSSIRKIGKTYYFIYAATNTSGLNYCTSHYPDRDFAYRGCIHNSSDIGLNGHSTENAAFPLGNYHGSIENINGQYYVFDHRHTNRCFTNRQAVAEPITVETDGSIRQVESTSTGLFGKPFPASGKYPAYIACNLMGRKMLGFRNPLGGPYMTQSMPDREKNPDQYVSGLTSGCIVGFKYFLFDGKRCRISLEARGSFAGCIQIMDAEAGSVIGKIFLSISGDCWQSIAGEMHPACGKSGIFFKLSGKGKMELNSFTIS